MLSIGALLLRGAQAGSSARRGLSKKSAHSSRVGRGPPHDFLEFFSRPPEPAARSPIHHSLRFTALSLPTFGPQVLGQGECHASSREFAQEIGGGLFDGSLALGNQWRNRLRRGARWQLHAERDQREAIVR